MASRPSPIWKPQRYDALIVVEHTDDPAGPRFHAGGPKGSTLEDQSRSGVSLGWDNAVDGYGTMERYRAIDSPAETITSVPGEISAQQHGHPL